MADNTILAKLDGIKEKYASISAEITDPEVMNDMKRYIQLNKEYKELGRTGTARQWLTCRKPKIFSSTRKMRRCAR